MTTTNYTPIHERRNTKTFCISSVDAKHIAAILEHYGSRLVMIATDNDKHSNRYTIRASTIGMIYDEVIEVITSVRVIERHIISKW